MGESVACLSFVINNQDNGHANWFYLTFMAHGFNFPKSSFKVPSFPGNNCVVPTHISVISWQQTFS